VEFAVFMRLTELVISTPDAVMSATMVGMLALPLIVLWVPVRAVQVIKRYTWSKVEPGGMPSTLPRKHRATFAYALLAASIYATLELLVVFASAKGGEVSVLTLPLYSIVPLALYIGFEIALPAHTDA
jgi:fatty acid desaturase